MCGSTRCNERTQYELFRFPKFFTLIQSIDYNRRRGHGLRRRRWRERCEKEPNENIIIKFKVQTMRDENAICTRPTLPSATTQQQQKQAARVRFIFECVLDACGSPQSVPATSFFFSLTLHDRHTNTSRPVLADTLNSSDRRIKRSQSKNPATDMQSATFCTTIVVRGDVSQRTTLSDI